MINCRILVLENVESGAVGFDEFHEEHQSCDYVFRKQMLMEPSAGLFICFGRADFLKNIQNYGDQLEELIVFGQMLKSVQNYSEVVQASVVHHIEQEWRDIVTFGGHLVFIDALNHLSHIPRKCLNLKIFILQVVVKRLQ